MSTITPPGGGGPGRAYLRVPAELWLKVFDQFYPPDYNKTAASFARTCRALREHAIPILYGEHIELYPRASEMLLNTVVNNPSIAAHIKSLKICEAGWPPLYSLQHRKPVITKSTEVKVLRKLRGVRDKRFPKKIMRAIFLELKGGEASVSASCILFYTPNLRRLSISGSNRDHEYKDATWLAAIPSLVKLEEVNVDGLSILDTASFLSIPSLRSYKCDDMAGYHPGSHALTRYKNGWDSLSRLYPNINLNLVTSMCINDIPDQILEKWRYEHMLRRCGSLKKLELCSRYHEADHGDYVEPMDPLDSNRIIKALLHPTSSAATLESLTIVATFHEGPPSATLLRNFTNLKELSIPRDTIAASDEELDQSLFFQLPDTLRTLAIWHLTGPEWWNFYRPSGAFAKLKTLRSTGTAVAENLSSVFLFHPFEACDYGWAAVHTIKEDAYYITERPDSNSALWRQYGRQKHTPMHNDLLRRKGGCTTKDLEALGQGLDMEIFMDMDSLAYDRYRRG